MVAPVNHTSLSDEDRAIVAIRGYLETFSLRESVAEIRGLECSGPHFRRPHTEAGLFDAGHLEEAAKSGFMLSRRLNARGVYFTLNPVRPDLIARRANRIDVVNNREQVTTSDSDIVARRWMLIDVDPERPSGVSSTDAEKAESKRIIDSIEAYLSEREWPVPVKADSGNGYHLLYRIDLPNDEASTALVRNCLRALSEKFSDDQARVDETVYNAARICKLYGTISRKGDHTPERPHRFSKIIGGPKSPEIVPLELLQTLAVEAPPEKVVTRTGTGGRSSKRGRRGVRNSDPVKAAAAYLATIPPAISGQGGHRQTYHAASILVDGFALSTDEALPLLSAWNEKCEPPWSQTDLERKLIEAEKHEGKSGRLLGDSHSPGSDMRSASQMLSFVGLEDQTGDDPSGLKFLPICNGEDDGESGVNPLPMHSICERIHARTDNRIKRVGMNLFAQRESSLEVDWLKNPASLFSWIGARTKQPPHFYRDPACHTREEVFEHLKRTAEEFKAIESLPHEPPLPGHYYTCTTPGPGNGEAVQGLLDHFSPETPIDRDLILANLATTIWGGPPGSRPMFLYSSDSGRGAGKSSTGRAIVRVAGPAIEFNAGDDGEKMKTRLLSSGGRKARIAVLDNVKTHRFSWAELEALVTTPEISGHEMYTGEGSRPNTLTWIITLNGIALSTDIAQRVVIIKLKKPEHSGSWQAKLEKYIDEYREAIIADLVDFLRSEPIPLSRFSRWGAWEEAVLSRLPDPNEAQKVIAERQAEGNVEADESEHVEEYIRERLEELTYKASEDRIFLPSAILAEWYGVATGEKNIAHGKARVCIDQRINEGTISRLSACGRGKRGRGMIWTGEIWDGESAVLDDIHTRIEERKRNNRERSF